MAQLYKLPTKKLGLAKPLSKLNNWQEKNISYGRMKKIQSRFLIDNQIFDINQLERWSYDEYKSLPKCQNCGKILFGEVFSNSFSDSQLFCSKYCSDDDYHRQVAHLNDFVDCEV
jgi:hypothetical protein